MRSHRGALLVCGFVLVGCVRGRETVSESRPPDGGRVDAWTPPAADSDGDGLIDDIEVFGDTDGDGLPDALDTDSDGDGLSDADESADGRPIDTDGDGWWDHVDTDSDNDGLSDADEAHHGTAPTRPDTDGDGATDWVEVLVGTSATDAVESPRARGDYVFVAPADEEASPDFDTVRWSVPSGVGRTNATLIVSDDAPDDGVDVTDFVDHIEGAGGGGACVIFAATIDTDGDGHRDTYELADGTSGAELCWDVFVRNNYVPATAEAQVYTASLRVVAGIVVRESHTAYFIVPPATR